jgi:hypothetical protein
MRKINQLIIICIFFFCASSCQFFEKQLPNEEQLLEKELSEINWKEVDEYPSVGGCDQLSDPNLRKQCFFDFISSTIQQKISTDTLAILYPKRDTIFVEVTIHPNTTVSFKPKFPIDSLAFDTIKIDSILTTKLADFPKVNPAIKRGIPVKTQFILPVIIKNKK